MHRLIASLGSISPLLSTASGHPAVIALTGS